jgi:hypothetical protein
LNKVTETILSLGLLLLCVGCDRDDFLRFAGEDRASLMQKMTPVYEQSLAIHCVDLLQEGKIDEVAEQFDPSVVGSGTTEKLAAIAKVFPDRAPVSVKTVDVTTWHQQNATFRTVTLEYGFAPQAKPTSGVTELVPRTWLFVQLTTKNVGGARTVVGLAVTPSAESIEAINAFTLANKGMTQYIALCLAVLIPIFGLYVAILCFKAKIGYAKWFWLASMMIGIGNLSVNWTTGQWSFNLMSLTFRAPFGPSSISASPYGPWMISIAAPVGAIAFLQYRRRLNGPARAHPRNNEDGLL